MTAHRMSVPRARRIVVFCMPQQGHIQRTLAVIEALVSAGCSVHVFTGPLFAGAVTRGGGRFEDLYLEAEPDLVDPVSMPRPCRYVTFAAHQAPFIARRVAALQPDLLIYDTFAVIGRVVAKILHLPAINICAGHAMVPSRMLDALATDPGVTLSAACLSAVSLLYEVYGVADASPFSYIDGLSSQLNLYAEPEQFLSPSDHGAFAPLAFFGSLAASVLAGAAQGRTLGRRRPRVFISFGSVVWKYFASRAERRLVTIVDALTPLGVDITVSTGGFTLSPAVRHRLNHAAVRTMQWAEQWTVLQNSDVFVTHQGLNSTHEAIWHRVPMLSSPFLSDQPALAQRCHSLGLALPICDADAEDVDPAAVASQFHTVVHQSADFAERLTVARAWERETILGRPAIVDRVLALAAR